MLTPEFASGRTMRARYKHLLPSKSSACRVNFWASSTNRVVETARYFATGFFGLNWTTNIAALHIISNSSDLGADTLTPQDTCLNYRTDIELGHDYGYTQLSRFSATYLPQIGHRLRRENPDIEFTGREIYSMQEMCGFEILARGESPWCNGRLSFGSVCYLIGCTSRGLRHVSAACTLEIYFALPVFVPKKKC